MALKKTGLNAVDSSLVGLTKPVDACPTAASVMNKGKVMGVNCVCSGGESTHSLCGIFSGWMPCQTEVGAGMGTRHRYWWMLSCLQEAVV